MLYAQIDETGLCFAVSQLAGTVESPLLIPLLEGEYVLGKRWDGGQWYDVPQEPVNTHYITRRQGLIALFDEENIKESDIQVVIDAIEDPKQQYRAQVEFNNQNWEINNEYVQQFAAALGITPERLQELFNIASNI